MEPDLSHWDRPGLAVKARRSRARQRGQGLVIFVGAIVFLIGLLAIVVDVTWYWAKTLEVQRAADAAALAGAVLLPDCPLSTSGASCVSHNAHDTALASAKQNGYVAGAVPGGVVTVTAVQNPTRDIQLDTSVSAPVPTFFMRLFGINSIQATRTAKAEYALPVPMGSPLNYFGAFGALRGWIFTDSGLLAPTTSAASGAVAQWTNPLNAYVENESPTTLYATTANATNMQVYGGFHIPMPAVAADARFLAYGGIEVVVKAKSSVASGCKIQAEVTSNASAGTPTWYGLGVPPATNNPASLTQTDTVITFGGAISSGLTDATDWWRTTPVTGWTTTNFADGNFAVRLKAAVLTAPCDTATTSVDYIKVRVTHEQLSPLITGPGGEPLNKQGVWAGILSQGADMTSGDIYSTQYVYNGSGSNAQYVPPTTNYNYAVEMQQGTTNGSVYVFDPVFCATKSDFSQGMGDHWYGSGAMSTFYDLYDTNNTPYDLTDDTWIAGNTPATLPASQGGGANPNYNLFKRSNRTDPTQGGPAASGSVTDCQRGKVTDPTNGGYWHNRWWPLATGLAGPSGTIPRVYRIHVTSTDPVASADQSSTNALNNFSLFANVSGHICPSASLDPACPRVYGLGTMEAFSPLDPSSTADLYLSQIGVAYAGKTIKVSLWDAGDTYPLQADLSFRMPSGSTYVDAPFTWSANLPVPFANSGAECSSNSGAGTVTSVRTSNSSSTPGLFNGCWLTILIAIPTTYTASQPTGEPGAGWWKIRYVMGSGSQNASDLTTWKTQIIGNPVHLVVP